MIFGKWAKWSILDLEDKLRGEMRESEDFATFDLEAFSRSTKTFRS